MWTEEKRNIIAKDLDRQLGPEYTKTVNGYMFIEGHEAIRLANHIFGFDGWSSEIRKMETEYYDEINRRHNVGVYCIMRITIKTGMFREDVGYGTTQNMPTKHAAFEKARKEAITDGIKRSLRQFGDSLGNCFYNKNYTDALAKMRSEKYEIDIDNVRRPVKKQKVEQEPHNINQAQPQPTITEQKYQPPPVHNSVPGLSYNSVTGNTVSKLPSAPSAISVDPNDRARIYPPPIFDSEDDRDDFPAPANSNNSNKGASQSGEGVGDVSFVTGDNADKLAETYSNGTLPQNMIFDPETESKLGKVLPQDRTTPVRRF